MKFALIVVVLFIQSCSESRFCDNVDKRCSGNAQFPVCDITRGQCVECLTSGDCEAKNQSCDVATHICVPCKLNSECASGVCKADGLCANASQIAYVDNKNGTCVGTHTGTKTDSFCQIADALPLKPFVFIAGSTTPYRSVAITTSGNYILTGPGKTANPTAQIAESLNPAIDVIFSGSLTIDGLDLIGLGGVTKKAGVTCSGTQATVKIINSKIHDSGLAGVESNGCMIELDANLIGPSNNGGGIKLTNTRYTITNNIIFSNGISDSPGVSLDDASSGIFAFNTVTKNRVSSVAGGIICGATNSKVILNSIVWGNDRATGTQFSGNCSLDNVVTGTDDSKGSRLEPAFVTAVDFHLKPSDPANTACCVDKIQNPTTANKDHDVDGTARPKGYSWDIGAHEVN